MADTLNTDKRARLLLAGLFIWASIATILLFNRTVVSGNEVLEKGLSAARRTYAIPARRGAIKDADGVPLAWSETRVDIFLKTPPRSNAKREELRQTLLKLFGKVDIQAFSSFPARRPLVSGIPPKGFSTLPTLLKRFPALETASRETRVIRPGLAPQILEAIGETKIERGRLRGVSEFELEHDAELRGRDGIFEVMADKRGRWIPGTWKEISKPRPGRDLTLPPSTHEKKKISRKKQENGL